MQGKLNEPQHGRIDWELRPVVHHVHVANLRDRDAREGKSLPVEKPLVTELQLRDD